MKMMKWMAAMAACVALMFSVRAEEAESGKTVRLLTVGNSFAENALRHLPAIVKASGNTLVVGRANIGGCPLSKHWKLVEENMADPEKGKGYGKKGEEKSLKELLQSDQWDFVTIQQFSYQSHDVTTYRPYAKNLYDFIKEHAPTAEVLLHETWAYRVDDPRFSATNTKEGEPKTQAEMHEMLKAAYEEIAAELGIRMLPSGDAIYAVDTDQEWGYKPDASVDVKTLAHPKLPDQTNSLHTGYRWSKEKGKEKDESAPYKLGMDGHHANSAGEYLAGCIWFEVMYGQSVVDNKYEPKGIDPKFAQHLRQVAHDTVAKRAAQATK